MSSRLRSLDSKISFFAFADIITAVSGVLIFVALLLATDLGQPTDSRSQAANSEIEQRLQETLAQQVDVDAQNQRLQGLLATAETAPAPEKLETDITSLRAQLAVEKKKHAGVAEQLAVSQSAIEARDRTLGLTDLKAQTQRVVQETESLACQEAKVREEMAGLDQRMASVQSKLLKLREREGKLWLIPDKSSTTKEPVLATISGSGLKVERFDHPDQAREFSKASAHAGFDTYLGESKPLDQYVVFLVRPSGIALFERLVKLARDKGFEVGFDALEEDKDIYFSTPPVIDETTSAKKNNPDQNHRGGGGYSDPTGGGGNVVRTVGGANVGPVPGDGSNSPSHNGGITGTSSLNAARSGSRTGSGRQGPAIPSASSHPETGGGGTERTNGSGEATETAGDNHGTGLGDSPSPQGARGKGNGSSTDADVRKGDGKASSDDSSVSPDPKKNPPKPANPPTPPPQPKAKSWWQRFLEWIGLR